MGPLFLPWEPVFLLGRPYNRWLVEWLVVSGEVELADAELAGMLALAVGWVSGEVGLADAGLAVMLGLALAAGVG
jgi:hypothetical protein